MIGSVSLMDVPAVVTSSMITTLSPSWIGLPRRIPLSPWSFTSLRLERGQGTKSALKEIEETYGLQTTAIVTMAEVVEHLYNKEYKGRVVIDDKLKAAIDAYYDQYGAE